MSNKFTNDDLNSQSTYATYVLENDQLIQDISDHHSQQIRGHEGIVSAPVSNESVSQISNVTMTNPGNQPVQQQLMLTGGQMNIPSGSRLVLVNGAGTIIDGNVGIMLVSGNIYEGNVNNGSSPNVIPSTFSSPHTFSENNSVISSTVPTSNDFQFTTEAKVDCSPSVMGDEISPHRLVTSESSVTKKLNSRTDKIKKVQKNSLIAKKKPKCIVKTETIPDFEVEVTVPHHTMDEFAHNHHLTKSQVEGIFMILGPHYTNPGRRAPLKDFVLASLVLLTSKESYREMSERMVFKSRGWMHKTIHLFCNLMVKHLSSLLEWPSGNDSKMVVDSFESVAGFPGVIGVLDSHHMALTKAPFGNSSSYYANEMQFHSIHLLAVVDHRYRFSYVNVGRPGSFHESKVFNRSSLSQLIDNDANLIFPPNTHLLANETFPLNDYVLTPYIDANSQQEKNYNNRLSQTTAIASHSFNLLKARWQRLKCLEMQKVSNMTIAVKTCCILHNICTNNDQYCNEDFIVDNSDLSQLIGYDGPKSFSAIKKRDMISNYLNENRQNEVTFPQTFVQCI